MSVKSIVNKVVTPFVTAAATLGEKVQERQDVHRGKEAIKDGMRAQFAAHGRALREAEEAKERARRAEELRAKLEEQLAEVKVMGEPVIHV